MSTPPTVLGTRDSRKSPLTGLSIRRISSTRSALAIRRSSCRMSEAREDLQGGRQAPLFPSDEHGYAQHDVV